MDRRNFLRSSCILCGVSIAGSSFLLESCAKDTRTVPQGPTVNFILDLTQSGNSVLKSSGGSLATHGVVVVNTGGSYTAVAQRCTHNGCSVAYNISKNDFICPCHGGTYDINGKVISGPPPAPLKTYSVTQNGNVLTIAG